jgi:two-component system OmpR family sensor kinase
METDKILDLFKDVVIFLEKTKIKKINREAKSWGFKEGDDILNYFTYNNIDKLVNAIINVEDITIEDNIYFFSGNTRFCRIRYYSDQSLIIIEDRTDFKLLEKVKSDFISSLSHELRTPLSVAKGSAYLLNDFLKDENLKKYAKKITESIDKIERIVEQLTLLSMAQLGNYNIKLDIIDPKVIIDEVLEDLKEKIEGKNIKLNITCNTDQLKADKFILYTILRNLISNAVKYSYENSEVKVFINSDMLIVSDSGIGIREEEQKRIFERFFRGSEASKYSKGSGLGLTIVKYFCEIAGYKIEFDSKWMIGTKFIVRFK